MWLVRSILFLLGAVVIIWMVISGDSPVLLVVLASIYSLAEVVVLSVRKIGLALILKASLSTEYHTMETREIGDLDLERALQIYNHK